MRPTGLLKYAMRALTERKLRAVLTILGIVIGPATIVSLVGATQGYSNASTAQFSTLGATTLFVAPVGRGTTLTATDVNAIQSYSGVSAVLPYQQLNGQVSDAGYTIGAQIVAVDFAQLPSAFPALNLANGSVPADSDTVGAAIGYSIANPGLQGANNFTVNQVLTVSGAGRFTSFSFNGRAVGVSAGEAQSVSASHSFVVRGTYGRFGQGFGINPDDTIFIPLASGELILHSSTYTGIMVVASNPNTVTEVTDELTAQYGSNIRITSVSSLLSSIQSVTGGVQTLLEAVGGTSVLVAFIGIMTTMLTSVLERTKEIGVLKALGSSSRGIMAVFLTEAVVTGLLGGLIGVGAGYGLSFLVIGALSGTVRLPSFGGGGAGPAIRTVATTAARSASGGGFGSAPAAAASSSTSAALSITPVITPEVMILAILLAVAVGTFGGLIPAWRASRLNPVEALRRS